jgi:hypothetical protein
MINQKTSGIVPSYPLLKYIQIFLIGRKCDTGFLEGGNISCEKSVAVENTIQNRINKRSGYFHLFKF